MDELPKCRLCQTAPSSYGTMSGTVMVACHNRDCVAVGYAMPAAAWLALHGPRLAPEHVASLRSMLDHGHKLWLREAAAIRAALAALGEE